MGNFNFIETKIKDLYIIEPKVFGDDRGYFMETYNKKAFEEAGLDMVFVQDNESKSKKGVLRGMHFQTKFTQGKLVRCTQGEVYDVAVDLRKGSPTYGQWEGVLLSAENKRQFYVPEGFAHGFLTISDESEFRYKCDNLYCKESEGCIRYDDPTIHVDWGTLLNGIQPILSEKDETAPTLENCNANFIYKVNC